MRGYVLLGCTTLAIACSGGAGKKHVKKPKHKTDTENAATKTESEEDRAAKRLAEAEKMIPAGSSCLPASLKEDDAPQLELAANNTEPIVCAIDTNKDRLLGPVACWKVDLATGALAYKEPSPLPGRGFMVKLDDHCAHGYCIPKDAKISAKTALMSMDLEGKKMAVLVGDDVHLFDAETKEHQSGFSIRGDKGVTSNPVGLYFVGDTIAVEGADEGANSNVWLFKTDGTQQGPVMGLGGKDEKPVSTYKGSVSVIDKGRIALAEHGMDTLTTFKLDNGERAKLVRTGKKPACKPAELDAYWHDGDKVGDKCKGSIEAISGHLIGATVVAGAKNFLVLYRGDRLGELGVLDAKTLAEHKTIKMPWCSEGGEGGGKKEEKGEKPEKEEKAEDKKTEHSTRGGSPPKKQSADPEEGGE